MGHKTIVSPRQLLWGVILCLVCSSLISPAAGAARLPAWGRILAAAASAALVWLLLLPFMAASGRERFVAMLAGYGRGGKVCLVLFSLCFALAAGRGLERTETFYRYVSPDTLPLAVFVALLLTICLYAARCGLETLLRAGLALLVLTAASLALVLAGNAGQMRLENLQLPRQPLQLAWESLAAGFSVAPELLLLGIFAHSAPQSRPVSLLGRALTAAVAVDLVLACAVELALGQFGALQVQPLHTLARIGSLSVFRRLDAVHVSVWLLAAVFRPALLSGGDPAPAAAGKVPAAVGLAGGGAGAGRGRSGILSARMAADGGPDGFGAGGGLRAGMFLQRRKRRWEKEGGCWRQFWPWQGSPAAEPRRWVIGPL